MGLVNIQNTNFDNGVTNRNAADLFGSMGQLDPTKFHSFMDDFDLFTAPGGYTAPSTGSVVPVGSLGASISIQTGAVDTNVAIIRAESLGYIIQASQRVYFRARIDMDDVIDADGIVGLADGAAIEPDDGLFFLKPDGVDTVDLVVRSGASEIARVSAIATMSAGVPLSLEFYWDGIDRVYYGSEGTPLGFLDLAGLTLPSGLIGPTVGSRTGNSSTTTMTVDYLFAAQERE
jgi:hypothetical protein